jgi:hypothetical protein
VAIGFLHRWRSTFVERSGSFFLENSGEAVPDSQVLRVPKRLINKAHLDDLKGLHHEDLGPASYCATHKTSEQLNVFTHTSIFIFHHKLVMGLFRIFNSVFTFMDQLENSLKIVVLTQRAHFLLLSFYSLSNITYLPSIILSVVLQTKVP